MTKKVLHVIETLGHGGAEHQLSVTVGALDRTRFESIVCHLFPPDHLAPRIQSSGVRVIGLGLKRSKWSLPEAVYRLVQLIREQKIELVHTSLFQADLAGGAAGAIARVPVVNTLCNMMGGPERLADNRHMNPLKLTATMKLWGATLNRCHRHSIAISRAVLESAFENLGRPREKMSVIYRAFTDRPAAVDVSPLELKMALGIQHARPILLNIGRLAPQKGQRYLIEAMPEIVRAFPKAVLLIVGDGWLKAELESLAKTREVADHVKFLGRREDARALIELSDQFVFPSLFEGLGVSLIEAAGIGATCVATRVGPIPEVIEHGSSGVLVPPQDPVALACAIIDLATNESKARALGAAAKARVRSVFTVERMIRSLEDVYGGASSWTYAA
jgi:glycosyltransferase involved in cell wall biosynthesis